MCILNTLFSCIHISFFILFMHFACVSLLNTAMQVAVRRPSKGTLVTLWLHEHFAVFKNNARPRPREKRELDFYQAVEFSTGRSIPAECRLGLSDKEIAQIWVKGIYFAPASRIRRARQDLPKDRYIFQKDTASDWEPAVQYRAEMGIARSWLWSPIARCGIQCLMCSICCRELCIRLTYKPTGYTLMAGTGIMFAA
jgi:hypothetical protein